MKIKQLYITAASGICLSLFAETGSGEIHIPGLPQTFTENIRYYHSFSGIDKDGSITPDRCKAEISKLSMPAALCDEGIDGSALLIKPDGKISFCSDDLSLRHNQTVSFWFNLKEAVAQNDGGMLLSNSGYSQLTKKNCFISFFTRGGDWCGLTDTALVAQMYNFSGAVAHNNITDKNFRENYPPDRWNNLVVTSNGKTVKGYMNGRLIAALHAVDPIAADDNLINFQLCGDWNIPVLLDELLFLDVTLSDDQVRSLYNAGCLLLEWQSMTW